MTGGRYGKFRRGFWSVYFNYDIPVATDANGSRSDACCPPTRSGVCHLPPRNVRELGGFNPLLSPFHWEDVDLAYRGWKRGWDVRYEPRSVAYHKVSATIDAISRRHVDAVSFRNRLLFHWINLHSPTFLVRHILMLAILLLTRFRSWIGISTARSLRRCVKFARRSSCGGRKNPGPVRSDARWPGCSAASIARRRSRSTISRATCRRSREIPWSRDNG